MKRLQATIVKNAAANLIRGGATAAVALALPRFLTRTLPIERFGAWSLILQIAAYASYLDFGLQTAVARFVAESLELKQRERQSKLMNTAFVLLGAAGVLAFALISVIVWQFPHLFHGIQPHLLPEFQAASLVLSLSACILLPLSTYTGVLVGMRRNEIPALAIGLSRIVGAIAAIIISYHTQSLIALAACIGLPNLIGGVVQMAAVHSLLAEGRVRYRHVDRSVGKELLWMCSGLMVWSFAMLLVSGIDVTIVGHFQFSAVGYYSIATTLITFFAGLSGTALSALMAPVTALHARGETKRIQNILFSSTRLTVFTNALLTILIFIWGSHLLRLWVGPVYAERALPILEILAIAQTIRLTANPYAVMLISADEQRKGIGGAIFEALLNLTASILGAILIGPSGVAWGTAIGAIGGLLWTLLRIMPSVKNVHMRYGPFLRRAALPGLVPAIPLAIFGVLIARFALPLPAYGIGLAVCLFLVLWLAKRHLHLLPKSQISQ